MSWLIFGMEHHGMAQGFIILMLAGLGGWGGAPVVHRQERRFTLFRYELKLTLMNATNQLSVYEATVRSEDRRGNLVKIMPNLLSSIFLNFPGKNGVPVSVESTLK